MSYLNEAFPKTLRSVKSISTASPNFFVGLPGISKRECTKGDAPNLWCTLG